MSVVGDYSKTQKGGFDETRRFIMGFVQKGIPWVDADENKKEFIRFTAMRRAFDVLIGNASPNNGFKPVGTGASNDFTLKGGDGTLNGAGRMYVSGMGCFLVSDTHYLNNGSTDEGKSLYSKIHLITGNSTIHDNAANYVVGELVGRTITPDVTQPGITATITANTANTITVGIDLTGAGILAGARYRLELSPPLAGSRTDDIYLNAAVIEVSGADEPSILNDLGTAMQTQLFGQVTQTIFVKQGGGSISRNYIDVDGFEHFLTKIGTLARTAGQAAINGGDVLDLRETSGSLTAFLPKTGGTMTGDIILSGANVVMSGAERVDGRDVSVDGAKLDAIDFTPSGVAAKLQLISWPVQGTDLTGVATATLNVSKYLKDRVPGGSTSQKGVITSAPLNRVIAQNSASKDDFLDTSDPANKVFGRLTEVSLTLSGQVQFAFGSTTIAGIGSSWLTQLVVGDIILGADGRWYAIATLGPAEGTATLDTAYLGADVTASTVTRQRWTLSLFSNVAGVETVFTPGAPINVSWFWHEVFDEATRPVINPFFGIPSDQVAGEIPDATTALHGKVRLALDDGTDSTVGRAVQASDVRLGAVKAQKNGAGTTGLEPLINVIEGTGISITVVDAGGKISITISNSAPGGGGIGLSNNNPLGPGTAAPGTGGSASRDDHVHPPGSFQSSVSAVSIGASGSVNPGFTPKAAILVGGGSGLFGVVAVLAGSSQANATISTSTVFTNGKVYGPDSNGNEFTMVGSLGNPTSISRGAGAATLSGAMLAIG